MCTPAFRKQKHYGRDYFAYKTFMIYQLSLELLATHVYFRKAASGTPSSTIRHKIGVAQVVDFEGCTAMHVRTISKQFKHFRLKWPGDVELISGESGVDMNWIRCIYKYLSLSNTRTQRPDICPTRCFASKPSLWNFRRWGWNHNLFCLEYEQSKRLPDIFGTQISSAICGDTEMSWWGGLRIFTAGYFSFE